MNAADKQLLVSLSQHEGWHLLTATFRQAHERQFLDLAKKLMRGDDVSPLELAEKRGYYMGIAEMLAGPDRALRSLLEKMNATE